MDSDAHNAFGEIEQDNNPSFYGNPSAIIDPYGQQSGAYNAQTDTPLPPAAPSGVKVGSNTSSSPVPPSESSALGGLNINDSLTISTQISTLINLARDQVNIDVISTERLATSPSVVVYCIELKPLGSSPIPGIIVKRRYSEFKSLRDNLMRLFPTVIIPPIPPKHTFFTYLLTSINTSEETSIVETRRRMFAVFLQDLVHHSSQRVRDCVLVHKFFDPNYESCWDNAIHEPPVTLVPDNLLLANPIDPTNQNGLYSLLPVLNGYEPGNGPGSGSGGSTISATKNDKLGSLKRLNEDLQKLNMTERAFDEETRRLERGLTLNGEDDVSEDRVIVQSDNGGSGFVEIPISLTTFEERFIHSIKVTSNLDKLNSRTSSHLKSLVHTLVELGSNLNNFSLQIHSPSSTAELNLAEHVERFGSTVDVVFLNYEAYITRTFVPKWQEPIHQLIQNYLTAIQLLRFYKLKLVQFKILKKSKFRKSQELEAIASSLDSQRNINEALKNGLELNSPSITNAVKRFEQKQLNYKTLLHQKRSWYGLFGGKNRNLSYDTLRRANEQTDAAPVTSNLSAANEIANANQYQYRHKLEQIERELAKLDQLITLTTADMAALTEELEMNFKGFMMMLEKRWLQIMLEFIRGGKRLFEENLQSWQDLREGIEDGHVLAGE
ncbi:PX domain-containing protein [[Candida] zeylanoides]